MKISRFGRYALSFCVAAAMLAGCGGSQPLIGAPGAMPQGAAQKAHPPSGSGNALIYAFGSFGSGDSLIMDYPSGKVVTSFDSMPPVFNRDGACSDGQGDVYFGGADLSSGYPVISEYAYGATSPFAYAVITGSPYTYGAVFGCSVDNTTGEVAALIQSAAATFTVAVFQPQLQGTPQFYQDSMIYDFLSVGYDGNGNLFLLGTSSNFATRYLAELPKGGSSFGPISLNLGSHVRYVAAVQWDGKYVTIEGAYGIRHSKEKTWRAAVYRLNISGSTATISQTIILNRVYRRAATWIAPSLNGMILIERAIREFKYPAGGKETAKLSAGDAIWGTIAVPGSQ